VVARPVIQGSKPVWYLPYLCAGPGGGFQLVLPSPLPPSLPPSLPELNCNTVPSWLGDVNLAPLRVLPRREREYVTPVVGEELGGHEQQQQEHEQARPLLPDCGDRS